MDAFWEIPLDQPPKVAAIGRHAHGFQPIDRFCLPDLWMLHLYSYNAELKIENLQLPIRPSYVGLVPPGKATEYRYQGISVHVFVHFRLQETGKVMRRIPAMQDLGDRYDAAYRRLFDVIAGFTEERERVDAGTHLLDRGAIGGTQLETRIRGSCSLGKESNGAGRVEGLQLHDPLALHG